jgi:hypothetical protein
MKYWNRNKEYRKTWSSVEIEFQDFKKINKLKRWCQQDASTGRFFIQTSNGPWRIGSAPIQQSTPWTNQTTMKLENTYIFLV